LTKASAAIEPVRARLLRAAADCFLVAVPYQAVSTRQIAQRAGVNVSMIRYYFGSKQGLYEAVMRDCLDPLLQALDGPMLASADGFAAFLKLYYDTALQRPALSRLALQALALRQGPGCRLLLQMLGEGRLRAARQVAVLKRRGELAVGVDPDLLRMAFISLALMPMLMKDAFEAQMPRAIDEAFVARLAAFNGGLLKSGLAPRG
jgi:AcrR family transcriptional regulator